MLGSRNRLKETLHEPVFGKRNELKLSRTSVEEIYV